MNKYSSRMILILTLGVFGILNTEMGIVGILPMIAEQYNVSIATAGWLVSGFALVVAVSPDRRCRCFFQMNRKALMLVAGGIFMISNIISAFAPNFSYCLSPGDPGGFPSCLCIDGPDRGWKSGKAGGIGQGCSESIYWSFRGNGTGGSGYQPDRRPDFFTVAMLFFAAINIVVFALTVFFIPSMPATETISYGKQIGVLKNPSMVLSIIIVIFLNGAIFGFTNLYIRFYGTITDINAESISLFLLFYGLANIVGNMIAGKVLTVDAKKSTFVLPFALFAAYAGLFLTGRLAIGTAVFCIVIGALAGINSNVNQYLITEAGPQAPEFSNGLYLTSANLGTTFGTFICGLFITAMGTRYSLYGTFTFIVIGLAAIALKMKMERQAIDQGRSKTKGEMIFGK
ncbi:MAG: MFS transporter [[Clostridium] scindens]